MKTARVFAILTVVVGGLVWVNTSLAQDWDRFGVDPARSNFSNAPTGITPATLGALKPVVVQIPGTVDSSLLYLHGINVLGAVRDVFFGTTSYGRTFALDANSYQLLWVFSPKVDIGKLQAAARITTATPVIDPERQFIYAASPDGFVRKIS